MIINLRENKATIDLYIKSNKLIGVSFVICRTPVKCPE